MSRTASSRTTLSRTVVLVGMMGSGKTTVGRQVASALAMRFIDTDDAVVAVAGKAIRDIFAQDGEAAFRAVESQALASALASTDDVLVAAAGGTVLSEVNRQAMRDTADMVVWLDADPTTLGERTSRGAHRPLLDGDPASRLAALDTERRALYASVADVCINTAGKSIHEVVQLVMNAVTAEHAS